MGTKEDERNNERKQTIRWKEILIQKNIRK